MIVRAIRADENAANWITNGKEYVVLELQISHGNTDVMVITDEGGRQRAVFPLSLFEIVDGHISPTWVVTRYEHHPDSTFIGPAAWANEEFWTDFDGDWFHALTFDEMADRSRQAQRSFDAAVADMHIEAERPWVNTPDAASDFQRR